jgi:hypothetical protein
MEREKLEGMSLEALRTIAAEQGIEGARALGRAQIIAQLASGDGKPNGDDKKAEPEASAKQDVDVNADADGDADAHEPADEVEAEVEVRADAPAAPPKSGEPFGILDLVEPQETYNLDECEILFKDPSTVFVYWEITEAGLEAARAQLGPSALATRRVLRLFTTISGPRGVERLINDIDIHWNHGRRYLQVLRSGAHVRVAVGLLAPEGYFASIAHSQLVRVPPEGPAPPSADVEWMEVQPGQPGTLVRTPISIVKRGSGFTERGVTPDAQPLPGGGGSGGLR